MSIHDEVDQILHIAIEKIAKEVDSLSEKEESLTGPESNKLIEYIKALVIVRKDWRLSEKEQQVDVKSLTNEELEAAVLAEAEKIKGR